MLLFHFHQILVVEILNTNDIELKFKETEVLIRLEIFVYVRVCLKVAEEEAAGSDDIGGAGGGEMVVSGSQSSAGDGIREITLTRLCRKPQRRSFRGSIAIRQDNAMMEISPFK